jgi:hypothetical protein
METSKNKILGYLADIDYMAKNDESGFQHLLLQGEKETVTLKDVAFALSEIIDHFEAMLGAAQLLQELRLQSIVANLDEATQEKIISEFNEVGDDLFTEEDTTNDN